MFTQTTVMHAAAQTLSQQYVFLLRNFGVLYLTVLWSMSFVSTSLKPVSLLLGAVSQIWKRKQLSGRKTAGVSPHTAKEF